MYSVRLCSAGSQNKPENNVLQPCSTQYHPTSPPISTSYLFNDSQGFAKFQSAPTAYKVQTCDEVAGGRSAHCNWLANASYEMASYQKTCIDQNLLAFAFALAFRKSTYCSKAVHSDGRLSASLSLVLGSCYHKRS